MSLAKLERVIVRECFRIARDRRNVWLAHDGPRVEANFFSSHETTTESEC